MLLDLKNKIYTFLMLSNIWLHTFESWKLVLWLMFPIANAGIWWFVAAVIFAGKEDSDRYLKLFLSFKGFKLLK